MNTYQKPGDLLLGILEFFGILIPGAVFTFLYGDYFLGPLGLEVREPQEAQDWVVAFFVAILLGHILHSLSDPLDRIATRRISAKTKAYLSKVSSMKELELPSEVPTNPKNPFAPDKTKNLFYAAFSYIRIHNQGAVAELERHAADFKMFRSITLLFLLDIPLSAIFGLFSPGRLLTSFFIVIFAAFRFYQLFDWTYALAFDLFLLVQMGIDQKDTGEKKG